MSSYLEENHPRWLIVAGIGDGCSVITALNGFMSWLNKDSHSVRLRDKRVIIEKQSVCG